MKGIVFLAVLGFAAAGSQYETERMVDARGLIENGINKTLNDVLNGLEETINIDELPIDFGDGDKLSGGLNATSITVNGVKSLVATAIHLNIFSLTIDLDLHIKELLVNFKYWADALLLKLVPLYGEGRINIALEEIDLAISGSANLTDGIKLKDITVGLSLGDATFDLNGLINNPEFSHLVSAALNDNFVSFVNKNAAVISSVISPIVEMVINAVLGGSSDALEAIEAERLIEEYRTLL